MTSLATIVAVIVRTAKSAILALPLELRVIAATVLGIFTVARATRSVPLNSAFTRRVPEPRSGRAASFRPTAVPPLPEAGTEDPSRESNASAPRLA